MTTIVLLERRPKFFALSVVSEHEVRNAESALGPPDGRFAELGPGAQIVLRMEKDFVDTGEIFGKGEINYGLEGLFHVGEASSQPETYAWMIIGRDSLRPLRFLFSPASSLWGSTGVNTIRITNLGSESLLLDAVIGYGYMSAPER